jgi:hypothetical protein
MAAALVMALVAIVMPLLSTASFAAIPARDGGTLSASAQVPGGTAPLASAAVFAAVPGAPLPPSTQFDITGFLQEAKLGGPGTGTGTGAHQGGSLKVDGHTIIIPSETIVILPANALTWQELFAQSPAPYTGVATGMALADAPAPMSTYEVHAVGNRVGDTYIAGLVDISQQALNSGAGYINFIDYTAGELRVGGVLGDATTGARVRINDPGGRFGRIMTPDQRFTVDPDNPTIASATGFPMCFPRTDPAGLNPDALCPQRNRPANLTAPGGFAMTVQMADPALLPNGGALDPRVQAPLEVGDYVTFAGTLVHDGASPTAGPWPAAGTAGTYISAHTIVDNTAIYTWPGTNPAYVSIETSLMGTGGLSIFGATEAAARSRFEGMATDASRAVHIYGVDFDPATGATRDRDWGMVLPDPGLPNGAVKGRWRIRPPCTATAGTITDKRCSPPPAGVYVPPPREMRAVIEGAWVPGQATAFANGIVAGQYHAPIQEYIFPENIPGNPIVENNFNVIDFLTRGGYTSSAGTQVCQLNPWPSNVIPPAAACGTSAPTAPVANAGAAQTVPAGTLVTLAGSANGTAPLTFSWAQAPLAGEPAVVLAGANTANPTFTAPAVVAATTLHFTLTVQNSVGSATASTTVTVNAVGAPTVNHVAPISVFSGANGSIAVSGTDPGGLKLTFTVTQAGAPALLNLRQTSATNASAVWSFTAPPLPLGQVIPSVINLTITAKNSAGAVSAQEFTTVTINPLPDIVGITIAEYRTTRQRLDITATSNIVSPNVVLKLNPYVCQVKAAPCVANAAGVWMYNPDPAAGGAGNTFTNTGGGLYTITLVTAPEPAIPPATPLTVTSNLNGASAPSALTRIRQ